MTYVSLPPATFSVSARTAQTLPLCTTVPLSCLPLIAFLCTPLSFLYFFLPYQHSIPYTRIPYFDIYISYLPTSHILASCLPLRNPIKLATLILGGISTSICMWSIHTSASIMFTPFHLHNSRRIAPISSLF